MGSGESDIMYIPLHTRINESCVQDRPRRPPRNPEGKLKLRKTWLAAVEEDLKK